MIRGAPRLGTAPGVPPVVRGAGGRVRRHVVWSHSWRGRRGWPVGPTRGAVTSAWRVAAGAPSTPWRAARRWPARPTPRAARRLPRPSNHGVQLTPLARPWDGRDSPGNPLRPADNPTMRNLQLLRAAQRSLRSTGRPHAHCLAAASLRRPPPSTRLPAAQLTPVRWAAYSVACKHSR